jgi:hypothetical protein
MNTGHPARPLKIARRIGIALASCAGIALIAGWSLTGAVATDRRTEVALRSPDTRVSATRATPATAAHRARRFRRDASAGAHDGCHRQVAGQGKLRWVRVIVAVLRIDTPVRSWRDATPATVRRFRVG